jgi:hypothetical protein
MKTEDWTVEEDTPDEERRRREQLSAQGMRLLTLDLTHEGDSFLIAVAAALLMGVLYPLVGAWSLLAFPLVFVGALVARSMLRRRRVSRR